MFAVGMEGYNFVHVRMDLFWLQNNSYKDGEMFSLGECVYNSSFENLKRKPGCSTELFIF